MNDKSLSKNIETLRSDNDIAAIINAKKKEGKELNAVETQFLVRKHAEWREGFEGLSDVEESALYIEKFFESFELGLIDLDRLKEFMLTQNSNTHELLTTYRNFAKQVKKSLRPL